MSNSTAPARQALPTNRSHSFVNHSRLRHRGVSDAAQGSSTPRRGRAAESGKKQQDCHTGDKICFYFTSDSSGSFSCAEVRAVSTSLHFPSYKSAAHHLHFILEHMSPAGLKSSRKQLHKEEKLPSRCGKWKVKTA